MKIVKSVKGVPVRLTAERLEHIERRHPEMKGEEDGFVLTAYLTNRPASWRKIIWKR